MAEIRVTPSPRPFESADGRVTVEVGPERTVDVWIDDNVVSLSPDEALEMAAAAAWFALRQQNRPASR